MTRKLRYGYATPLQALHDAGDRLRLYRRYGRDSLNSSTCIFDCLIYQGVTRYMLQKNSRTCWRYAVPRPRTAITVMLIMKRSRFALSTHKQKCLATLITYPPVLRPESKRTSCRHAPFRLTSPGLDRLISWDPGRYIGAPQGRSELSPLKSPFFNQKCMLLPLDDQVSIAVNSPTRKLS